MLDNLIVFEGGEIGTEPGGYRTFLDKCRAMARIMPLKWPRANDKNEPYTDIVNVIYFLKWAEVEVFYETFGRRFMALGLPNAPEIDEESLRDLRETMALYGLETTKEGFKDWVLYIAQQNRKHAVLTFLGQLTWDNVPRLDTWLTDCCGVDDTPYTRAVGQLLLIAAVRRVRTPGIKFDMMVVFEGKQGQGKSTIPRILASDVWFTDDLKMGLESKEIIEKTAGKWIVEIAELHGMSNKEVEIIKSSISRAKDTARGAYRQNASTVPRAFLFVGTTNDRKYLKDPTGNRRFLPIFIPGDAVDLERLRQVRDQLWAEAVVREAAGDSIALPESLWAEAAVQQQARTITDPKAEVLMDLFEEQEGFVATDEIYRALELDPAHREQRHQALISSTMHEMGWEHVSNALAIKDGVNVVWRKRGWRKGEAWRERILFVEGDRCVATTQDEVRERAKHHLD